MSASLDRVVQPDGSVRWQMVEISEAKGRVVLDKNGNPEVPEAKPARKTRTKKAAEPAPAPTTEESVESSNVEASTDSTTEL